MKVSKACENSNHSLKNDSIQFKKFKNKEEKN